MLREIREAYARKKRHEAGARAAREELRRLLEENQRRAQKNGRTKDGRK